MAYLKSNFTVIGIISIFFGYNKFFEYDKMLKNKSFEIYGPSNAKNAIVSSFLIYIHIAYLMDIDKQCIPSILHIE